MKNDIVKRLRSAADTQDWNWDIYDEAADEIVRLRGEVVKANRAIAEAVRGLLNMCDAADLMPDEIAELLNLLGATSRADEGFGSPDP